MVLVSIFSSSYRIYYGFQGNGVYQWDDSNAHAWSPANFICKMAKFETN